MQNRVTPLVGVDSMKEERDIDILYTKIPPSTMLSLLMSVARLNFAEPHAESARDMKTTTLGFSFSAASGENKNDENV